MKFSVATIYPEFIEDYKKCGIVSRALDAGHIEIEAVNIRDYTKNKHGKVDDYVYGGGPGMLMTPQPVYDAITAIKGDKNTKVVYFDPKGEKLTSKKAKEFASLDEVILLCGHYEGIDQRAIDLISPELISIGDYILTGGHIAATVFIDSVIRYIPGVLGSSESALSESFENGLLEQPQYTRPREFMGLYVPEILLSGDHSKVDEFNAAVALKETAKKRSDLLKKS